LTVKLRGRTATPDGAEGAQFPSARGAKPQAHHGPLQRLLADDGGCIEGSRKHQNYCDQTPRQGKGEKELYHVRGKVHRSTEYMCNYQLMVGDGGRAVSKEDPVG